MLYISDSFSDRFAKIGFTPEMIFTDSTIRPWRSLPDRQNCVWDFPDPAGPVRLHVKRFPPTSTPHTSADLEAEGIRLLEKHDIPTAPLVAYAKLDDGRSFIITADLAGYVPADKWLESGHPFERILDPTSDLSAILHRSGLHHRDLYLCHFLVKDLEDKVDLRLIDAARVRPLPGLFTRRRWIVKDLAQFWYSTLPLPISDDQRTHWLVRYCEETSTPSIDRLRGSIQRKAKQIANHDEKLKGSQPNRNISIPKM